MSLWSEYELKVLFFIAGLYVVIHSLFVLLEGKPEHALLVIHISHAHVAFPYAVRIVQTNGFVLIFFSSWMAESYSLFLK